MLRPSRGLKPEALNCSSGSQDEYTAPCFAHDGNTERSNTAYLGENIATLCLRRQYHTHYRFSRRLRRKQRWRGPLSLKFSSRSSPLDLSNAHLTCQSLCYFQCASCSTSSPRPAQPHLLACVLNHFALPSSLLRAYCMIFHPQSPAPCLSLLRASIFFLVLSHVPRVEYYARSFYLLVRFWGERRP